VYRPMRRHASSASSSFRNSSERHACSTHPNTRRAARTKANLAPTCAMLPLPAAFTSPTAVAVGVRASVWPTACSSRVQGS
jgi:hypothetical protein